MLCQHASLDNAVWLVSNRHQHHCKTIPSEKTMLFTPMYFCFTSKTPTSHDCRSNSFVAPVPKPIVVATRRYRSSVSVADDECAPSSPPTPLRFRCRPTSADFDCLSVHCLCCAATAAPVPLRDILVLPQPSHVPLRARLGP